MRKNEEGQTLGKQSVQQLFAVVCLTLAFSAPSLAQDAETALAGGAGFFAQDYRLSCDSKALIGVKGKAGDYIDSIRGICVEINPDGSWKGAPTETAKAGGGGGTQSFDLRCPSGQAISAIKGKTGSFVDQLKILCSPLNSEAKTIGSPVEVSGFSAGSTGGTSFGPLTCPDNKPAKGLRGKHGSFIDSIGLVCNFPTLSTPPAGSSSLSDLRIKIENMPSQVREDKSFTFTISITKTAGPLTPNMPRTDRSIISTPSRIGGGVLTRPSTRFKASAVFEGPYGISIGHVAVGFMRMGCEIGLNSSNQFTLDCESLDDFFEGAGIEVTATASQPGTWTLKTNVDPTNVIRESDENNNTAQHTVKAVP